MTHCIYAIETKIYNKSYKQEQRPHTIQHTMLYTSKYITHNINIIYIIQHTHHRSYMLQNIL